MKKVVGIFIAFLVVMSQFGVHAASHYCMDRLTNLELSLNVENHSDDSSCVCGMDYGKKSGCCHDVVVHSTANIDGILLHYMPLHKQFASIVVVKYFLVFWFEPTNCHDLKSQFKLKPDYPPQWLNCWVITKLLI